MRYVCAVCYRRRDVSKFYIDNYQPRGRRYDCDECHSTKTFMYKLEPRGRRKTIEAKRRYWAKHKNRLNAERRK